MPYHPNWLIWLELRRECPIRDAQGRNGVMQCRAGAGAGYEIWPIPGSWGRSRPTCSGRSPPVQSESGRPFPPSIRIPTNAENAMKTLDRFQSLFRKHPAISMPGALLITLLQRTPTLPINESAGELAAVSPVGDILRSSAAAAAALGALHSLAVSRIK